MSKLRYIPLAVFIALPGTFILTYAISIGLGHVYPVFPSISDTGSTEPESCVFSQLLNLTVAALFFVIYVRHKEITEYFRVRKSNIKFLSEINLITTTFGIAACLGLDVVANFQINRVEYVHDIGALVCYWSSAIYIFLQTVISFWMCPEMTSMFTVIVRGILGCIATAFIMVNLIAESFGEKELKDYLGYLNRSDIMKWEEAEPGWSDHLTSGVAQWVTVVSIGAFIFTYYIDFKRVTIYPPELIMVADPVPKPVEATSFKSFSFVAT